MLKFSMNKLTFIGWLAALLATGVARATLYTETFNPDATIPEGNPVGVTISGTISDIPAGLTVGALTVHLTLTGGYNGGLSAYLVAPNGATVILMNQPGVSSGNPVGATGTGMNITLQDGTAANGNIQNETSGSVLSGSYNAAGSLSGFNGSIADGTWTLYFADLAGGGGSPDLTSWSLDITPVPELVPQALAVFLGLVALHWSLGRFWTAPISRPNPRPFVAGKTNFAGDGAERGHASCKP